VLLLLVLVPPGMVFDHPSLCLSCKGEGNNPHFLILLQLDVYIAHNYRMLAKMKIMVGRGDQELNVVSKQKWIPGMTRNIAAKSIHSRVCLLNSYTLAGWYCTGLHKF
jgi:hypothetical protein